MKLDIPLKRVDPSKPPRARRRPGSVERRPRGFGSGGIVTPPQVSDSHSNQGPVLGSAIIDWFSFTIPVETYRQQREAVRMWCDLLGGGKRRPRGLHGYTEGFDVLGTGVILYHPGDLRLGVHVSLPSSALARLPELGYEALDFLQMACVLQPAKPTRLDIAIDTDRVRAEDVLDAYHRGEYVGKLRNVRSMRSESGPGMTIYFGGSSSGKRQSNIRRLVRVYDKAAESGYGGVWTRCEVEFRHEHAQKALRHLLEGAAPEQLIVATLDFRVGKQKNTDERQRASWWSAWVGNLSGVKFALEKVEQTIERIYEWVKRQVGPSLAALMVASNHDNKVFYTIVDHGFRRLKDYRLEAAKKYCSQVVFVPT